MREPSDGLAELKPHQLREMVRRYKTRSTNLEAQCEDLSRDRKDLREAAQTQNQRVRDMETTISAVRRELIALQLSREAE